MVNFHFKTIKIIKELLDCNQNPIASIGEIGFCSSDAPPGELLYKPQGHMAIVMENYNSDNARWLVFEPYDSFNWEEHFEIVEDTKITLKIKEKISMLIEHTAGKQNGN